MSKPGRCDTCAHDGCCEHYCGGAHWSDAYVKCAQCGCELHWEHVDYSIGVDEKTLYFCCEDCYKTWAAENGEDEEEVER